MEVKPVRRERMGWRDGGKTRVVDGERTSGEGGRSRRPVVYTGFGVKVIMIGSGGCKGVADGDDGNDDNLGGDPAFLCAKKREVRICCRLETCLKGVIFGR